MTTSAAFYGATDFPCDIVEVRLDRIGPEQGWPERCQAIEAAGKPVLLTIRMAAEGGAWKGTEEERRHHLEAALETLAAVDVELGSALAPEMAARAAERGKVCVLSHHDFAGTPSAEALEAVMARAEALGGVTKIATMIHGEEDAARLKALLAGPRRQPLCVIGMGESRANLRIELGRLGSCLAYGYLDSSAAPGQISAAALKEALHGAAS